MTTGSPPTKCQHPSDMPFTINGNQINSVHDVLTAILDPELGRSFILLRRITLELPQPVDFDVDFLVSPDVIPPLVSKLVSLARTGNFQFRLLRTDPKKVFLAIYSPDMTQIYRFDLWLEFWQLDDGMANLQFDDLSGCTEQTDYAFLGLPIELEATLYVEHLLAKKRPITSTKARERLAWYVKRCGEVGTSTFAQELDKLRLADHVSDELRRQFRSKVLAATRVNVYRAAKRRRFSLRFRVIVNRLQQWKSGPRVLAIVGPDGAGKTTIGNTICNNSNSEYEFITGKELYRYSLPFRALYRIKNSFTRLSGERADELFAWLAYLCAYVRLKSHRYTQTSSQTLLIDRFLPDFLYVGRKTDTPHFVLFSKLLAFLTVDAHVVYLAPRFDVLSSRKQEITERGYIQMIEDIALWYGTSSRFDYFLFQNNGTANEAADLIQSYAASTLHIGAKTWGPKD